MNNSPLYRYRPLTVTKSGKSVVEELRNLELFFATPSENNDPMDGLQVVYWEGDEVLWANLVRHYCLCLFQFYQLVQVAGDSVPVSDESISARMTPDNIPAGDLRECYDAHSEDVLRQHEIGQLLRTLTKRAKLYQEELAYLFLQYHSIFVLRLDLIASRKLSLKMPPGLHNFLRLMKPSPPLEEVVFSVSGDEASDYFQLVQSFYDQTILAARFNNLNQVVGKGNAASNWIRLITSFPKYYAQAASGCIYPEYYTSSFSLHNDNPTTWAYYGGNHRGICLIFDLGDQSNEPFIQIGGGQRFPVLSVRYEKPTHLNFFQSLSYLTLPLAQKYWLTDGPKRSSVFGFYDSYDPKPFWETYKEKIAYKMPEWKSEQEVRAVHYGFYGDPKEGRLLHYNFEILRGIIFGLRTAEELKLQIFNVIKQKLGESGRSNFDFYQAEYSRPRNVIAIRKLSLLSTTTTKAQAGSA